MRKFTWLFFIGCFVGGIHTAAIACNPSYDPATRVARIPCVGVVGDTLSYDVVLEGTGGSNFVLTAIGENAVRDPHATSLRILTTPMPVAIVFGFYPDGCWSAYHRPTFVQTGNHIDIRVKAQLRLDPDIACTLAVVPFVESVYLWSAADPKAYTYSINGVSITPTF